MFIGYTDGTFKPNKPINRAEAVITAVKLMGLEAEAEVKQNVTLNFKDAETIQKHYGWATGYIAVALEKGLFDSNEDSLQLGKEASRVWAASLLVRAAQQFGRGITSGVEEEEKAKTY
ncbi:S-layer homology domain-containing protein [Effusibacillus consociatus]|uniref:S-layer homology domain-containing protein n=1 Tax=Effusibacillus consociatus TaxID=1117041 RepID=A0ABV9Q2U3_9BACL